MDENRKSAQIVHDSSTALDIDAIASSNQPKQQADGNQRENSSNSVKDDGSTQGVEVEVFMKTPIDWEPVT